MSASNELPLIAAAVRMNVAEERQDKTFQHVCNHQDRYNTGVCMTRHITLELKWALNRMREDRKSH